MRPNPIVIMKYLQETLFEYRIKFGRRADDALIMEVRSRQGTLMLRRAISADDQIDADTLRDLVQRIRRDLLLEAGPLPADQTPLFRQGSHLPTFIPHQACRQRRQVKAGEGLKSRWRP